MRERSELEKAWRQAALGWFGAAAFWGLFVNDQWSTTSTSGRLIGLLLLAAFTLCWLDAWFQAGRARGG